MEPKIIDTGKVRLLLVDVPEGAMNFTCSLMPILEWVVEYDFPDNRASELKCIDNSEKGWKILGMSDKLTEEQLRQICTPFKVSCAIYSGELDTARETFNGLLFTNGIYEVNPYEKPDFEKFRLVGRNEQELRMIAEDTAGYKPSWASIFRSNYQDKLKQYEEAEKHTSPMLVLIEEKG